MTAQYLAGNGTIDDNEPPPAALPILLGSVEFVVTREHEEDRINEYMHRPHLST